MKILIIGLDGGTWQVFDDFLLKHHMPNLYKLRQAGVSGVLRSTDPPITPAAWTTCITGCEPYSHHVLGFKDYSYETELLTISSSASCTVPTMFEKLSEQGYTVASVNVPWTYPCREIHGICIAGYGIPDTNVDFTWPVDFKKELLRIIPDYDVLANWVKSKTYDSELFDKNIASIERSFTQRVEATRIVFEKIVPDLLMVQFQDTDLIQHHIWPHLNKDTRDNQSELSRRIFSMYAKLDGAIGELLTFCDDKTIVAVVSDHGFCKMAGSIKANKLLYEWGYLKFQSPLKNMMRRVYRQFSGKQQKEVSIEVKTPVDWKKSKAMLMYAAMNGHLYLNVEGRNPFGTVKRGAEYERCIADLTERFSQVKNLATGEKLFTKIVSPREFYEKSGEDSETLGDLILVPSEGFSVEQKPNLKGKSISILDKHDPTGCHHHDGIYIFNGPGIKSGFEMKGRIVDFAPTIYAAIDAEVPGYVDGKVMNEIFSEKKEIRYHKTATVETKEKQALSEDEQAMIQQRLAALGYMD
jgi:predicted AlkP superfamily phosphohydrolase/phosphomutase